MNNKPINITINKLDSFSDKDAKDIKSLVKILGDTFQPLSNKELKSLISSPVTNLFVAREPEKQKIIGMATLAIYRIPYLKKAYMDDFVVDENHRGQGIGSSLIKTVLSYAKKSGAVYIEFTSNPTRLGANKFYEKVGFKKRDTNVYRYIIKK